MTELGDADIILRRNAATYARLEHAAERWGRLNLWRDATAAATIAGRYAWYWHPGRFRLDGLEQLLARVGGAQATIAPVVADVRRVLHVATEVHSHGGHSRLLQHWVANDTGRRHDLALTAQPRPVPGAIISGVAAAGGTLHVFDRHESAPRRAAQLRRVAANADLVVLHQHPGDVIPSMALPGVAPVAAMNHADHVAWLGLDASTWVLNLRESGADLAVRRRGVHPSRCLSLPIPLTPTPRRTDQATARGNLGIPVAAIVLFTMASHYKYEGYFGLRDLVAPVLGDEHVHLVAVGPAVSDGWAQLKSAYPHRVHLPGLVPDPATVMDAADIYLDSYPTPSLTSILEAAAHELPSLSYAPAVEPDLKILQPDSPGLTAGHQNARTPDEYELLLRGLIDGKEYREELGASNRENVTGAHTGEGWRSYLDLAYKSMRDPIQGGGQVQNGTTALDRALVGLHQTANWACDLTTILAEERSQFSIPRRLVARVLPMR